MSLSPVQITTEMVDYCTKTSVMEAPALRAIRERTQQLKQANMMINPLQGQFMQLLCHSIGAKRTLDIGVFTGYSALAVALALPKDGQVIACDVDPVCTEIAQDLWAKAGMENKIDLRIGPASDSLNQLIEQGQAGTFDFAFIDADKAAYDTYYEQCLTLCRVGAIIVLDNMLDSGTVADATVKTQRAQRFRALNDKVSADGRVHHCLLPLADGLLLATKI